MLSWLRRLLGSAKPTESADGAAGEEPESPAHGVAFNRPARWEDVLTTTRLLNGAGVEYALVGGYALAAHGHVRMTQDIDIAVAVAVAVAVDPANTRRWIKAPGALPDGRGRPAARVPVPCTTGFAAPMRTSRWSARRCVTTLDRLDKNSPRTTKRIIATHSADERSITYKCADGGCASLIRRILARSVARRRGCHRLAPRQSIASMRS